MKKRVLSATLLALCLALSGCVSRPIVVYTDMSRSVVMKLFQPFTERTGVAVNIVHFSDAENLVEQVAVADGEGYRLVEHGGNGRPDLVLSQEMFTGEVLRNRGALVAYRPAGAGTIPTGAKMEEQWYGIGGRAWVLAWNTQAVAGKDAPHRLMDLAQDHFQQGMVCTTTPNYSPYYVSAVAVARGCDTARGFYQTLIDRRAAFAASPQEAADSIAQGTAEAGLTTLAAAAEQQRQGAPIAWAIPDQCVDDMGAFVEFYSVCLLKGGGNSAGARAAEDFLLTTQSEQHMVDLGLCNATLRDCGGTSPVVVPLTASLEDASRAYSSDLADFMGYFRRHIADARSANDDDGIAFGGSAD